MATTGIGLSATANAEGSSSPMTSPNKPRPVSQPIRRLPQRRKPKQQRGPAFLLSRTRRAPGPTPAQTDPENRALQERRFTTSWLLRAVHGKSGWDVCRRARWGEGGSDLAVRPPRLSRLSQRFSRACRSQVCASFVAQRRVPSRGAGVRGARGGRCRVAVHAELAVGPCAVSSSAWARSRSPRWLPACSIRAWSCSVWARQGRGPIPVLAASPAS